MDDWQWKARVDTDADQPVTLGAGFLIDARRVLTCAHVVDGCASVRVSFPGGPEGVPATVTRLTDWVRRGDLGDVALLRLDVPVGAQPARFARPDGDYWAGELRACGYREGFEPTGSYVTMRTAADMTLGREWWQLDVDPDHSERLAEGFSGAAVYRAGSGEVVGMVTDADLARGGLMGMMLPLSSLRCCWEALDELLDLSWLTAADRAELRAIVRGVTAPAARAYAEAFPGPGRPREFESVWQAICFVAEECFEDESLPQFLSSLARYLPAATAQRLAAWSRGALGAEITAPAPGDRRVPASVIIRLERCTHDDAYELTLSSLVHGVPGQATRPVRVPASQVREVVEKSLPALVGDVIGHEWMIEFALPESWLCKPVEEWKAGDIPFQAYPVVVRDVERLKPAFRQDQALQRWAVLRKRAKTAPEPVGCADDRTGEQFFYWLTAREDVCVLVHAQRPRRPQLASALNAGIPVMVWPRAACRDHVHGQCSGARLAQELLALVSAAHPDDLPRLVKKLRAEARAKPSEPGHCGRRLTLFWDDPTRLPDPPLMMAP